MSAWPFPAASATPARPIKTRQERLSPAQRALMAWRRANGARVYVSRSVSIVDRIAWESGPGGRLVLEMVALNVDLEVIAQRTGEPVASLAMFVEDALREINNRLNDR